MVVFAADYPFLDILWTMIIFFCWVAWIWLLIMVFSDLFRRDVSGWAKAAWVVFLIILPFLGVLIYLIAEGKGMTERRMQEDAGPRRRSSTPTCAPWPPDGGGAGAAGEIEKAKSLLDSGAIDPGRSSTG